MIYQNTVHSLTKTKIETLQFVSMIFKKLTNHDVDMKLTDAIIHELYQNVFKLEDIAGQLHVNSSYLSHLTFIRRKAAIPSYRVK